MKLIYTLYAGESKNTTNNFCGYRNSKELLDSLLLSSTVSSKHFTCCELFCDVTFDQLIKDDGRHFPFTNIFICLDDLANWLFKKNWAYSKVKTYSLQNEPFVHLDCDAILSDGLPNELLSKKFIFQQEENLEHSSFGYYNSVFNEAKRLSLLPDEISFNPGYAMNMGLFGCLNRDYLWIVKKYCDVVVEYIKIQQLKYDNIHFKSEQPMLFEQLFIINILLDSGLRKDTDFDTLIDKNSKNKFLPNYRYSHFYLAIKRNEIVATAIKKELMLLNLY